MRHLYDEDFSDAKSASSCTIKILSDSKSSPTKQHITNPGGGGTTAAEGGFSSETLHQDDGCPVAESKYKQEELLQCSSTSSAFAVPMPPRFVKSVFVFLYHRVFCCTPSVPYQGHLPLAVVVHIVLKHNLMFSV